MSATNTCRTLQAIQSEASAARMGIGMTSDDDGLMEIVSREAAEKTREHKATCPICNPQADTNASPADDAPCTWVHGRVEKYKEVQTGLIVGYADHETAEKNRVDTLAEIRTHIDDCLVCRAAFKQYLPVFMQQIPV
jgi:ferredoxin-thioredoxin reductase catalytic subunit